MKFDKLYYFESAARNESFTLAAKEYHIAPSAISQQIKTLEENLGFSLFIRSTNKKVVLTKPGNIFYNRVKEILDLYKNAIEEARFESNSNNNILKIGICGTSSIYSLNNVIHKLKEKYLNIEIKLNQVESSCCSSHLRNNSCDILFSNKNSCIKNENNLIKKIIPAGEFGILVDQSSSLAKQDLISFNDLISSQMSIYALDIYEKTLLEYAPRLKNNIKTEPSTNLLFASGFLNKGAILTTYEDCKVLNYSSMIFKKLVDFPINPTQCLYYLKDNDNWILKEFLELL